MVNRTKTQLVHNRHRAGTHRDNVAHNTAHTGGRALVGLHEGGVVVAFYLVGDGPAITDVYYTSVFTHTHQQVLTHLGGDLLAKLLEVNLGGLVGAVLRPHYGVHGQLSIGGTAPKQSLNVCVLFRFKTQLRVGHFLIWASRSVLNGIGVLHGGNGIGQGGHWRS